MVGGGRPSRNGYRACAAFALVAAAVCSAPSSGWADLESLRVRVVAALSRDLESEVSLDALETSFRPASRIVLRGLSCVIVAAAISPPIQIRSLTADVSLTG